MRKQLYLVLALFLSWCSTVASEEIATFEGLWRTTNRKLDGTMTCVVTAIGNEKWQGRFYGVWQGVAFDYSVTFTGPRSSLRGTATIDGANYSWTGQISSETPRSFKGSFGGSRYEGHFDLKEGPRPTRNGRQENNKAVARTIW
jgi:hypothetical protein